MFQHRLHNVLFVTHFSLSSRQQRNLLKLFVQVFKKRLYYCMMSLSQAKKCQQSGFSPQEQQ
jgi:hypothetical protein